MLKMTKYSVVALATLIIGCGSGSSNKGAVNKLQNNGKPATIQGLRALGDEIDTKNLSNTKIRSSASNFENRQNNPENESICQSGTMDFTTSNNQQVISFNFNAKNCNDGYSTINGSARMEAYGNDGGGFVKIIKDLTISDEYFSLFAKKGSFVKININANSLKLTAGFKSTINGEEFSASNLSVLASGNENGGSFSITSGQMIIGDYYFEVDTSSKSTPIVTGKDGFVSGTIKLLDGAGHKVEIAVVSAYELAFKIDENGDGTFSKNEILTENIKDAFDLIEE
jgi:hypothetical protein